MKWCEIKLFEEKILTVKDWWQAVAEVGLNVLKKEEPVSSTKAVITIPMEKVVEFLKLSCWIVCSCWIKYSWEIRRGRQMIITFYMIILARKKQFDTDMEDRRWNNVNVRHTDQHLRSWAGNIWCCKNENINLMTFDEFQNVKKATG